MLIILLNDGGDEEIVPFGKISNEFQKDFEAVGKRVSILFLYFCPEIIIIDPFPLFGVVFELF